jgi:hypothetical protein
LDPSKTPSVKFHGEAALYQPIPFLKDAGAHALRAAQARLGDVPYHEAPTSAGATRFAVSPGSASPAMRRHSAIAELRIPVRRLYILVPGQLGVFALADAGRVFLDSDRATNGIPRWARGCGYHVLDPGTGMSLAIADSEEGTSV